MKRGRPRAWASRSEPERASGRVKALGTLPQSGEYVLDDSSSVFADASHPA